MDTRGFVPEYQPRGMASCLRCGHLVRVASRDGAAVELVDPERRAAGRWAGLLGSPRPRDRGPAERARGHAGSACFALALAAPEPAPEPWPARKPRGIEPRASALRIAGVPWLVIEELGYQPTAGGRAKLVVPWGSPQGQPSVAVKRRGQPDWRIWTVEDRIGEESPCPSS